MNFLVFPIAILVFLLPGFAWLLVSGLLKRLNVLGAIALSFILSLCVVSVTSALLSLLTPTYLLYTILLTLILPIIIAVVYLGEHGFIELLGQDASISPLVLLCLVVYAFFLLAYFWSMPYYPTTPDSLAHAQFAQSIASGDGRSVFLHSNYPVGLHFVAAVVMAILGVNAIHSLNILASFVLMACPVLIFTSAEALLGDKTLAAVTTVVGTLILPVDAMHLVLIGTYPNMTADAIVFIAVFLLFSYLREPSSPVGATIALLGLAGVFIHSSFLLFLAALWLLLPFVHFQFRGKNVLNRYFLACVYSTVGVLVAVIAAISFLRGNLERVAQAYAITNFIGGATAPQLFQNLGVVYGTLGYNVMVLVRPLNLIVIALGLVFIAMRRRQSIGRVFAASWFAVLVVVSFLSGETDRFVLFAMIPAIFLVGNLVGEAPVPKELKLRIVDRRFVLAGVLLVLIVFGGFLPLISVAFSPATRLHEQNVFASMKWLQQNPCPSGVASIGLEADFRFLPILTNAQYSGPIPSTTSPMQVLQDSRPMGFSCVVVQTDNPNFHSFELNQAFREKYRNAEVAIFFLMG